MSSAELTRILIKRGWRQTAPAAWRAPDGKVHVFDVEDDATRSGVVLYVGRHGVDVHSVETQSERMESEEKELS